MLISLKLEEVSDGWGHRRICSLHEKKTKEPLTFQIDLWVSHHHRYLWKTETDTSVGLSHFSVSTSPLCLGTAWPSTELGHLWVFCLGINTGQCQYCQHVSHPWHRCGRQQDDRFWMSRPDPSRAGKTGDVPCWQPPLQHKLPDLPPCRLSPKSDLTALFLYWKATLPSSCWVLPSHIISGLQWIIQTCPHLLKRCSSLTSSHP